MEQRGRPTERDFTSGKHHYRCTSAALAIWSSAPANEVALAPTGRRRALDLAGNSVRRPLITAATQDKFVPQMVNFDELGAVDFRKGLLSGPGNRRPAPQYRGQVKRRMVGPRARRRSSCIPGRSSRAAR